MPVKAWGVAGLAMLAVFMAFAFMGRKKTLMATPNTDSAPGGVCVEPATYPRWR